MSLGNFVKTLQNIMRGDSGINGDAQRIEQMTWMLFLKIYDKQEESWEFEEDNYQSIIPEELRWKNWAVDKKDAVSLTGDALLNFVNNKLFPTLKNLPINPDTPMKKSVVQLVFQDINQYMKDGTLLRQVVNEIDKVVIDKSSDRHIFGEIYETILKSLQSAGNAGEFYTPRAVTDFIIDRIDPKLGEVVADFACGTGGFLTSTLNALEKQIKTAHDREIFNKSIYGIEKKPLPYLLAITNILLHGIDSPNIFHGNSLERNITEIKESEKFSVIVMNPPYGGTETKEIKINFPADLRSSETADLFISLIMYRLKYDGRAAVIIPDGFLFGTDGAKLAIKRKLLTDFNLHTIIRLPQSVFSPYTSITTNILFFDKTDKTKNIWFYRVDMPDGYKHFSKTKPMKLEHFAKCQEWWNNRQIIKDELTDTFKAKNFSVAEIIERNFDLDLCGYPSEEEKILNPEDTIREFQQKRNQLNDKIDKQIQKISELLKI
ncbi:MAG: SAM-dependent DNA methyltransferase [Selenomonadaceae bacterium]|nr:SAM-dependent DNA methyltransferase [Selenomonadaceae bacterium]